MIDLSKYRKIHCIGIGGIGLSAVAEILMSKGYEVSGSDMRESDITENLMDKGAKIFLGHRAKNVENADLVVYTVAVGDDNPEIARAKELGIPTVTRAQALGGFDGAVRAQHRHLRDPWQDHDDIHDLADPEA